MKRLWRRLGMVGWLARGVRPSDMWHYALALFLLFISSTDGFVASSLAALTLRGGLRPAAPVWNVRCSGFARLRMSTDDFDFSAFEEEVQKRGQGKQAEASTPKNGSPTMDAQELRELVVNKWGRPFDTKIHRRRDGFGVIKYYLQVMWKHVEQQSFHMTEQEYMEQLEAVASLISEWGLADFVREEIRTTKQKPLPLFPSDPRLSAALLQAHHDRAASHSLRSNERGWPVTGHVTSHVRLLRRAPDMRIRGHVRASKSGEDPSVVAVSIKLATEDEEGGIVPASPDDAGLGPA